MFDLNLLLWYVLIRHWECLILPTAADSPINCNLSLRLSAVDRLRLLVIFKAKQNKRLIWFDLLLAYTLVTTVKMFAQKKLSWLLFVKYDDLVYI